MAMKHSICRSELKRLLSGLVGGGVDIETYRNAGVYPEKVAIVIREISGIRYGTAKIPIDKIENTLAWSLGYIFIAEDMVKS